jgi:hypothetical protein
MCAPSKEFRKLRTTNTARADLDAAKSDPVPSGAMETLLMPVCLKFLTVCVMRWLCSARGACKVFLIVTTTKREVR